MGALLIHDGEGLVLGTSRYYDDHGVRSVAIDYTFLRRSHWDGITNGQVKALMLDHPFKSVEEVRFHVGRDNLRSQRALAKLGVEGLTVSEPDPRFPPETYCISRLPRARWLERGAV
jgi:RimJ/RimL family protein N-acetyltransferase